MASQAQKGDGGMNLLLKVGLQIEKKRESQNIEKQQIVRGKYLDNLGAIYGLRRRWFENDAKFRKRILYKAICLH